MCKNHCAKNILKYELLKEYPVALKSTDSILCSQWINSRQIVFGTKCNKVSIIRGGGGKWHKLSFYHPPSLFSTYTLLVGTRSGKKKTPKISIALLRARFRKIKYNIEPTHSSRRRTLVCIDISITINCARGVKVQVLHTARNTHLG